MIPQNKITESLEKPKEIDAHTQQEQEREVGKDSSRAEMDPQSVTGSVTNTSLQDDALPWVIPQNSHPEYKGTGKQFS